MRIRDCARRLRRDKAGSTAIWTAASMSVIFGMGALAVDMGDMYAMKGQLQNTADASAIAAAKALPDATAATAAAQAYAVKNMVPEQYGTVLAASDVMPGNWNATSKVFTASATPLNAVKVVTRRASENGNAVSTYFAGYFGFDSVNVTASAIATQPQGNACIIALNPHMEKAFHLQGNAAVQTNGCDIQVNSDHATGAFYAQGLTMVVALGSGGGEINVHGAVYRSGPTYLDPTPTEGAAAIPDPYQNLAMPAAASGACDYTGFSATDNVTLMPGVYCGGISITGSGTATFSAGQYIIKDGPLSVAGTTTVVGNGVTFFMTGANAYTDFKGTADIGLSAPTTGPYTGFIFVGDRNNPATTPHLMRGTALGGYNGHIYFPNAAVEMVGTSTGTLGGSDCTVAVADSFQFLGTPNFETAKVCSDFNTSMPTTVSLVN